MDRALSLTALTVAIAAIGLGIAGLVLALDDDPQPVLLPNLRSGIGVGEAVPFEPDARAPRIQPPDLDDLRERVRSAFPQPGRAVLGITVAEADGGVAVEAVAEGSGADEAGIRTGDVITAVDGREIADVDSLIRSIREHEPGDEVRITIDRDGTRETLAATLQGSDAGRSAAGIPGLDRLVPELLPGFLESIIDRLDTGEPLALELVVGSVAALDDETVRVTTGDRERSFAITDATRMGTGDDRIAPGQTVIVVAVNGEARVILPLGATGARAQNF